MATTPNFAATPRLSGVLVSTSNTNTDGTTGTRATVIAAATNGTRVDTIQIKGITAEGATQAADSVRLWLFNGTTTYFWKEIIVPAGAGVVSATVSNFETTVAAGIDLQSGWSITASTKVGSTTGSYHIEAFAGDY